MADIDKAKKTQTPPLVVKAPILEVKEIPDSPSSFNFEHEIQKIRIPVPLSELVKHEDLKRSLSKLLRYDPSTHPSDSINFQDENPTFVLGPMV